MSLIPDEIKESVRNQLSQSLVNPVRIVMFTQELECRLCSDTKHLIIELASMSDKIQAEVHDFVADSLLAKEYGVENLPAVVITNERGYRIKFYGLPYSYEFQTLLTALLTVSIGKTDLSEETKEKL